MPNVSYRRRIIIQLTGWVITTMTMLIVDGSCQFSADSQPKSTGLVWGLAATRRSVYIHHVHAGDNCWHCYRLHYPRRPAQYINSVKPTPAWSETPWRLVDFGVCQNARMWHILKHVKYLSVLLRVNRPHVDYKLIHIATPDTTNCLVCVLPARI